MLPVWLEDFAFPQAITAGENDSGVGAWMILLRKKLSDGLIAFETDVVPAVEYFRKYSKYNFIEHDGGQAVEAVQL